MQRYKSLALSLGLVAISGCAAGGTPETPGASSDDAGAQAQPSQDGGVPKGDGGPHAADAAVPNDVASLVIDGVSVALTKTYFGRAPGSSGYYTMAATLYLADGYTFHITIHSLGAYPPIGFHAPAPNVEVEMFKTAEQQVPSYERENWRGGGGVQITANGADSNYEGSSAGTLVIPDSPFTLPPPPNYKPKTYTVSWKGVGKP